MFKNLFKSKPVEAAEEPLEDQSQEALDRLLDAMYPGLATSTPGLEVTVVSDVLGTEVHHFSDLYELTNAIKDLGSFYLDNGPVVLVVQTV